MPTALVTGASGFIGPHLVSLLRSKGYDVACTVRKSSSRARLTPLGVRFVKADVTDAQSLSAAVAQFDFVFHVAGAIRAFNLAEFMATNCTGTKNLVSACAQRESPPTVVLVSSLGVAGPSTAERPHVESDPCHPVSDYGRSKRAGEVAAAELARQVPLSIVRPAIVYGPGDVSMLNMFRPISRFHLHLVPTLAERRFSVIYADDLAEVIVAAGERGQRVVSADPAEDSIGYYYATGDEYPTYAELGRQMSQAMGQRFVWVQRSPEFLAWTVAGAIELGARIARQPTIMGIDKMRDATAGSWTCSNERARRELGFRPGAPLLDRLRQTVEWYRQAGWL